MYGRNINKWNIIIMLFSAIIIVFAGYSCYQNISDSLKKQETSNLQDVAKQNTIVMEKEFEARLDFLSSVAMMMRSEGIANDEGILKVIKDVPKIYGLKRIGFISTSGVAHTTDGYVQDLSFREFFHNAMEGKRYISKRVSNKLGDNVDINVFSVPVYNKGGNRIVGVLFATYETRRFRKIIELPSFDNTGYCYVIDGNGDVIIDSDKSPLAGVHNLFETWSLKGETEAALVRTMKNMATFRNETSFQIVSQGKDKLVYCTSLKIDAHETPLYLLTVVPAYTLMDRLEPVAHSLRTLLLAISLLVILSVGYIFYNIHRRDKELYDIAYIDPLTKEENFAGFKERWKRMERINGYIVAFDIDRFGGVAQTLGVEKSNELLLELWQLIKSQLSSEEMIAHVDQDEFIMLLCANRPKDLEQRLESLGKYILNLSTDLAMPAMHAVFGVYAAQEVSNVDAAYCCAVQAKNTVKGKFNEYCSFYNDVSVAEAKERQELVDSFAAALEQEAFEVWYQPKINIQSECIVGAEALVRWRKSNGEMISPGKFINVFESNGMIAVLDEYVFTMVCKQQSQWQEAGKKIVPISINVSRASLCFANIVKRYVDIAAKFGIDPKYLQLEITESATLSNEELEECLENFHKAGFLLQLDDFGSGYSSLAALYRLPFDIIKIDKSLIDYIEENQGGRLVSQLIAYIKNMGRSTTAEGVESKTQLELLRSMNCDDVQGYYYDKPLAQERFEHKYLN